jgi:hypothetical protein
MNLRHIFRTSGLNVAENIITCLSCGVILKMFWTSYLISRASSIWSHSSRIKCFIFSVFRLLFFTRARTLPGVPISIVGGFFFSSFIWSYSGCPPYMTSHVTLVSSRYFMNLTNSLFIWKASSLVWHRIIRDIGLGSSSNYYRVVSVKTAVLPIPDFAWHIISVPSIAWGMHSY